VIDRLSGDVVLEISNPEAPNGTPTAFSLMLVGDRLVALIGVHLTTWLASVDIHHPEATELTRMPRLPFATNCQPTNAVGEGDSAVVGTVFCRHDWHLYRVDGPGLDTFHLGPAIETEGNSPMLTGATPEGFFIGTIKSQRNQLVLQIHDGMERVISTCTASDAGRDDDCYPVPVW
jgi:hypothetical protein